MAINEEEISLHAENIKKDVDSLIKDGISIITSKTDLEELSPGSIARSLLELYYEDLSLTYEEIAEDVKRSRVSTARSVFLDEIGKIVNCERKPNESDENYRARIVNNTKIKSQSNNTAIRWLCRDVEGINDVEIDEFPRGTGSFDVYVISEEPDTSEEILDEVQNVIDNNKASGIDGKAVKPVLSYIDIYINIYFYEDVSYDRRQDVRNTIEDQVRSYIINLNLGSELIINKLEKEMLDVDVKNIKNVAINKMFIDNKQTLINNKDLYWNQRLVPNKIQIG